MRINLAAHTFDECEGYGRYANYLIRALVNAGVDVTPVHTELLRAPGYVQRAAGVNADRLTLYCTQPKFVHALPGRTWLYTMYEDAFKIPDGWARVMNIAVQRVIVPCQQNAALFKANGVITPIHVVNGGTSPDDFPTLPKRSRGKPFTFSCLGDRMPRKGTEVVLTAFHHAFPAEQYPDVRLVIKTRASGMLNGSPVQHSDRRVTIWREDAPSLKHLFEMSDCFVFPSYGEGWGMPPREAAIMGLPTIISNNTGLAEGAHCWATRVVEPYTIQDSLLDVEAGQWYVPSWQVTAEHMRWVHDHYEDALLVAEAGAAWLRENQTWAHTAKALIDLLERYG